MTATKGRKVTIRGKTYDFDDVADVVAIQSALVPENFKGRKADCVRLFIATSEMLSLQLKRHLGANWKKIVKTIGEEVEDGGNARLAIRFGFELDQTSPMVAAITKLAMAFSINAGSTGKPQTHDLTQGEFFDDDMSIVFDPNSIEGEKKEAAEAERLAAEQAAAAAKGDGAPGETPAEEGEAPAKESPRKRGRPRKSRAATNG